MSMNETGANQSAATTTESANQSAAAATTTTETTTNADHSEADFGRELDDEWGLPHEEAEDEETAEEQAETEETDETETASDQEQPPDEETQLEDKSEEPAAQANTLRVNYMGQAYELPEDDARKYAQIGMNAGRLQEKYDALKPLEKLNDAIGVMATFRGQDPGKLIDELADMEQLKKSEIKALVDQGTDEAVATELLETKVREAKQKHDLDKMKHGKSPVLTQYQKDQIDAFKKFRPKEHEAVTAGKPLPQEVVDEWRSGTDLSTAWLLHENKDIAQQFSSVQKQVSDYKKEIDTLKKEKAKLLKNAGNKEKAPTRKKGTGGGAGRDSIYSGWDKY